MNEATLKNLLIFLNKLADTGALKGTNDLMAFGETYQAVQKALTEVKPQYPVLPAENI